MSTTWAQKALYQNRIELLQGTLDMLILRTLAVGLAAWTRNQPGDSRKLVRRYPSRRSRFPGPALHRLEEQGWILSEWKLSENRQRAKDYRADRSREEAVRRGQLALGSDCRSDRQGDETGLTCFEAPFGRRRRERDLDDEIRFHLDQEARLRSEQGARPDAAAMEARRAFGGAALVKEVTRAMWTSTSIERILQDLRVARRSLARSPGYVAVVVATLALGIGATTALFTVVNGVLLRPLPFRDPDRLVMVWERSPFRGSGCVRDQ